MAVKEAAALSSYMPISFGDQAIWALYDSGATISQATPETIKKLKPYLEELDVDQVQFISAEKQTVGKMRLFGCALTSLVQVESGQRSAPAYTLVVENPLLKSFPFLIGLQTMSDLQLVTDHGHGLVRDGDGRPFRLYPQSALNSLKSSLRILSEKWKAKTARMVPSQTAAAAVPDPLGWTTVRRERKAGHRLSRAEVTGPIPKGPIVSPLSKRAHSSKGPKQPRYKGKGRRQVQRPKEKAELSQTPPPRSKLPEVKPGQWDPSRLIQAERDNNNSSFKSLVDRFTHETQRYLIRHAEAAGRAFPNFSRFLQNQGEKDPGFKYRWNSLWDQHHRWMHKPSKRQLQYPVPPQVVETAPSKMDNTKEVSALADGPAPAPSEPTEVPRVRARKEWKWDPTPPHLTTPCPKIGDPLPNSPLHLQKDFYDSLVGKAMGRWSRPFTMLAQAGKTREIQAEPWYRKKVLGDKGRGAGHAILVIPSPKRAAKTMESLLRMQRQKATTSALFLLPEDYKGSEEVQTFLHAYCQKGEVYRYGALFSHSRHGPALHLNQAVTEYWFDGERASMSALSKRQKKVLDKLIAEFEDCVGDKFDRGKQPDGVHTLCPSSSP